MESATSAYLRFDRQLLAPPAELGSLPLARANFESALERPGGIALGGWMLLPDLRFDSVEAYLDHRRLGAAQHVRRNDLADYLPAIAHAGEAGFSALLPLARSAEPRFSRVDLVGMRDGLPAARVGTLFRSDLTTSFELPPAELRVRVAANESAANFRLDGLRCAGELLSAAERQLGGRRPERLLEWGCGCGRIAAQLLDITRGVEINGCDIDEEAIDWCNARLRPDAFRVVPPEPPSSYENGSFDLVLGYSVFTHLTREAQNSWLEELHRIATPDALVLATVHGDFAASFLDARAAGALAAAGILDGTRSGALDGIAPDAYYRTTFQSREYTLASWGERFEILEYLERGCGNLQDLVVMRPRERPRRGGTSLTARTEPAIPPGPSGPAEASGRQQPIARGERGRTARASSLRLDPRLLVPAPGHRSLPVARGNFENAVERWDGILVSGWMLPLQQPFESVEIFLDQRPVGSAERILRDDLAELLPTVAHAREGGFAALLPLVKTDWAGFSRVDLIGMRRGRPAARMSTLFRSDLRTSHELPPTDLRLRTAGNRSPMIFHLDGLRCAGELLSAAWRHIGDRVPERLLDWGCGCGRITAQLLDLSEGIEISGCDFDGEAVAWCERHLQPAAFETIGADPSTPYADAGFDLVLGYSVFPRLTREAQLDWLQELQRITAPGGLVLATVQGSYAVSFLGSDASRQLRRQHVLDGTRTGVAPDVWRRTTFQTRRHTLRTWSDRFEILEYLERGCGNVQDLVVMRPRTKPRLRRRLLAGRAARAVGIKGGEVAGLDPRDRETLSGLLRFDPELLCPSRAHHRLPLARGYVEAVFEQDEGLTMSGWMLLPKAPFDYVEVVLDRHRLGEAACTYREDLGEALSAVPHAAEAGFRFRLPLTKTDTPHFHRVDLIGHRGRGALARMSLLLRSDLAPSSELPPPELRERVVGIHNPQMFQLEGLKGAAELLYGAARHLDGRSPRRLLEWGCGCGRVTAHLLDVTRGLEILGCDIDREAVAWCNDKLQPGAFEAIAPDPPTPYPDSSFDLIFGYSVFTHLTRAAQRAWLEELRRIVSPQGLVVVSVHGEFATSFHGRRATAELRRAGILDANRDAAFDGIAPDEYYRATFQSRRYTLRTWREQFEILDYSERGIGNLQDLVVMRPRW